MINHDFQIPIERGGLHSLVYVETPYRFNIFSESAGKGENSVDKVSTVFQFLSVLIKLVKVIYLTLLYQIIIIRISSIPSQASGTLFDL